MLKYYRIAGLTVTMDSFGRTVEQAAPYECEAGPIDFKIESYWPKVKKDYPGWSDETGEYMCTGGNFYKQLLDFGGMMLHSSAVVVDGKAYLFTADPGTGKSTHTQLYLQRFGDRAFILNDDKPALRLESDGWYAYGTPWSGKHDISVDTRVPVAGIAVLQRGEENFITPYGGIEAIHAIMKQVNRPKAAEYRIKLLELLDKLITQVPVWLLKCNMDPQAAEVSYAAMSGAKGEEV